MVHFNWLQLVPGVHHDNVHVAAGAASAMVIAGIAVAGRLALGSGENAVMPAGRFSLKGIVEVIVEFIIGLAETVIGEEGRKFVPMFVTIFLFIWIHNLLGLLPGYTPATDNINMTFALGLFSFAIYNVYGLKENGLSYLKHFFGPVLLLAPLTLVIELISHSIRPLTLGLRLQGNMMADHTVLSVFLDLFKDFPMSLIPIPAIFYGMGIFVSTVQAFVFTMLSMIYISMAIAHDH